MTKGMAIALLGTVSPDDHGANGRDGTPYGEHMIRAPTDQTAHETADKLPGPDGARAITPQGHIA